MEKTGSVDEPVWWIRVPASSVTSASASLPPTTESSQIQTTLENPLPQNENRNQEGGEIAVTSIDILPATLPIPSSEYFGERLLGEGILEGVVRWYGGASSVHVGGGAGAGVEGKGKGDGEEERVQDILRRASVVKNGMLVGGFEGLGDVLRSSASETEQGLIFSP